MDQLQYSTTSDWSIFTQYVANKSFRVFKEHNGKKYSIPIKIKTNTVMLANIQNQTKKDTVFYLYLGNCLQKDQLQTDFGLPQVLPLNDQWRAFGWHLVQTSKLLLFVDSSEQDI